MTPVRSRRSPSPRSTGDNAGPIFAGLCQVSFEVRAVPGSLERQRQLRSTRFDDRPANKHMDAIGTQLGEKSVVVCDREHAEWLGAVRCIPVGSNRQLNPTGHFAHGVDVEARVEFVEKGDGGLENRQLERLKTLAFTA